MVGVGGGVGEGGGGVDEAGADCGVVDCLEDAAVEADCGFFASAGTEVGSEAVDVGRGEVGEVYVCESEGAQVAGKGG